MKEAMMVLGVAASLMASTGGTSAKPTTTIISIDDFCDVFTVTAKGRLVAATDDPSCATGLVGGVLTNMKGVGKTATLAGIFNGDATTSWTVVFSVPFATGGTWILYYTQDGVTEHFFFEGTYSVVGATDRRSKAGLPFTSPMRKNSH